MAKNLFLIEVHINDESPLYTFMVEAKDWIEAEGKAQKIAKADYGEPYFPNGYDMEIHEIRNLEDVKRHLLLRIGDTL